MKIYYYKILLYQWGIGFLLTVACLSFFTVKVLAQEKTPPKPKEPSTILQMPKPVTVKEITGRATLPEKLTHGFAIDVADKVLTGNWDVKGRVIALEDGGIIFKTEKEETGHFVYRLPKGMKFVSNREQQIFIKRILEGYAASLGHIMYVTSENDLIIASGRIFGDKPREVRITKDLLLQQSPDQTIVISKSRYETIHKVPVALISDDKSIKVSIGEPAEFAIKGKSYLILVTESSETIPTKEYERIAEGKGYSLEYVITLK